MRIACSSGERYSRRAWSALWILFLVLASDGPAASGDTPQPATRPQPPPVEQLPISPLALPTDPTTFRPQFITTDTPISGAGPKDAPLIPPAASPAPESSDVELFAGLALLAVLIAAMWYVARRRA